MGEASQYISGSNGNIEISSSKFHLERTGDVTMQGTVTATAGKVAGWDISGNLLQNSDTNLRLNGRTSTPKITIGTHTVGNGPGIQLGYDGSGVLTFFAGQSASDHIKYVAGTGVTIKTAVFNLNTDHLDIDSGTKDGKIALGATQPLDIYGSG